MTFALTGAAPAHSADPIQFSDAGPWRIQLSTDWVDGKSTTVEIARPVIRDAAQAPSAVPVATLTCARRSLSGRPKVSVETALLDPGYSEILALLRDSDLFGDLGEGVDGTAEGGSRQTIEVDSGDVSIGAIVSGNGAFSSGTRARLLIRLEEVCAAAFQDALTGVQ